MPTTRSTVPKNLPLRAPAVAPAIVMAVALVGAAGAAHAQDMPPRTVGTLDVNALTTAPLWTIRTGEIDAEPAEIFGYVSDNANWPGWFEGVSGVAGDTAARTFTLDGGGEIAERIVAFDEPTTFAWQIGAGNPMGLSNHLGVLHVTPDEEDGEGSIVSVNAFFEHADVDAILPAVEGGAAAILAGVIDRFGGQVIGEASGTDLVTIVTTRIAEAPRDAVWKAVAEDFDDVAEWASVISEARFFADDSREGLLGGTRECFIPAFGSSVRERVTTYDEAAGVFAYEVVQGMPPFVTKGFNTWNVEAIDDARTRVSTTTTMQIAPGTPGLPIGLAKRNFEHVLSISLDELVHFVETGEPHPRELASRG